MSDNIPSLTDNPISEVSFQDNIRALDLIPFVKLENNKTKRNIGFDASRDITSLGAESRLWGIKEVEVKFHPHIGYITVTTELTIPLGALNTLSVKDNENLVSTFGFDTSEGDISPHELIRTTLSSDLEDLLDVGGRWNFEFGWRNGYGKRVNQSKAQNSPGLNIYSLVLSRANSTYDSNVKGLVISLEFMSILNNTLSGIPIKALLAYKDIISNNLQSKSILSIIDAILRASKKFLAPNIATSGILNYRTLFDSNGIYSKGWDLDPETSTPESVPSIEDFTFIITSSKDGKTDANAIQMLQTKPTIKTAISKLFSDQVGDMTVWSFLSEFLSDHSFDLMPYYPGGDKALIAYNTVALNSSNFAGNCKAVSFAALESSDVFVLQTPLVFQKNWVPAINPLNYSDTTLELSIDTNQGTATNASIIFDAKRFEDVKDLSTGSINYGAGTTMDFSSENKPGRDYLYSNYTQWINSSHTLRATILGEPRMYIQDTINLEGMTDVFNGTYQVTSLEHKISKNMFTSTLEGLRITNSAGEGFEPKSPTVVEESKSSSTTSLTTSSLKIPWGP